MRRLIPYGPAASTTVDRLTFETDEERLVISGSLVASRDRAGLRSLERILALVEDSVAALRAQELPERADGPLPDGPTIADPFA